MARTPQLVGGWRSTIANVMPKYEARNRTLVVSDGEDVRLWRDDRIASDQIAQRKARAFIQTFNDNRRVS